MRANDPLGRTNTYHVFILICVTRTILLHKVFSGVDFGGVDNGMIKAREARDEDDVLKKLRLATADGVGASGRLSAERVQTVLRHAQEVLQSYERSHGTGDFLNDTFQACDMKRFEFEVNRFSSGVLGVDIFKSPDIDFDDDEKQLEELKELVARKHWLSLQDWGHNDAVLTAKLAPITTKLSRLDPESSLDHESIRFHKDTQEFHFKQYRTFRKRCNEETARIEGELKPLKVEDLPDVDICGLIDLDGNKVGKTALEALYDGKFCVKLILKDPITSVDIQGIGSGIAEINQDGTAKEVKPGSYTKPRGRAPFNKAGEPATWCSSTGTWLGVEQKKSPAKKRQKTDTAKPE